MAYFYHVSPRVIKVGETIKRTMKPLEWRKKSGYTEPFACLSYDLNHAEWWMGILNYGRKASQWFIHKVEVPDDEVLELCIDGLYYNFAIGLEGKACEIADLGDVPLDSEVIITTDNAVVVEVWAA